MSEPHVLYNAQREVATITLNRPEARNAFSPVMITLWREFLDKAKADDAVRAIIITGKGDTFCSGGDIREMAEGKLKSWNMKNYLWENTKNPNGTGGKVAYLTNSADQIQIVVCGGEQSGHVMWLRAGMGEDVVSKPIALPAKAKWEALLAQAEKDLGPLPPS